MCRRKVSRTTYRHSKVKSLCHYYSVTERWSALEWALLSGVVDRRGIEVNAVETRLGRINDTQFAAVRLDSHINHQWFLC